MAVAVCTGRWGRRPWRASIISSGCFIPLRSRDSNQRTHAKLDAERDGDGACAFNGDARAYPIREMAYHHIVNDVVGGVPIAATY